MTRNGAEDVYESNVRVCPSEFNSDSSKQVVYEVIGINQRAPRCSSIGQCLSKPEQNVSML